VSVLSAPPLPTPPALRLMSRGGASSVKPPFGLARWDDAARDIALVLDRPPDVRTPKLEEVAAQIPLPSTLEAGTLVIVLGDVAPPRALLGRWLGARVRVPRHLRSSALLARGYVRLGGGIDPKNGNDVTWGYVAGETPETKA
jgi:hypothetical protein